jgi:predicted XRE-type DNA-binding protein
VIGQLIRERGITQNEIAKILSIAQPDVSNILRGRFSGFSLERLVGFVSALGNDVRINVTPTEKHKTGRVLMTAS